MSHQSSEAPAESTDLPRRVIRWALPALIAAASILIAAAPAGAQVNLQLAGPGAGTVTSDPEGIECSNVGGGQPGPECTSSFGMTPVELTATAEDGSVFSGWDGDDPFPGFFGPTCNEGSANPCVTIDPTAFGLGGETTITATFDCAPPVALAEATTGDASAGPSFTATLAGAVNPNGCAIEESYFEYGLTTDYGSTAPTTPGPAGLGSGDDPVAVSASTVPLEPETTYHFRLVVTNPAGTAAGEDRAFTTPPAPADACPNADRRAEQGVAALLLPACMALEMVTPPNKHQQDARLPQVSAAGERIFFLNSAGLEDPPSLPLPFANPYVASRSADGWSTQSTSAPVEFTNGASSQYGSVGPLSLAPDFSQWFNIASTERQLDRGVSRVHRDGLQSPFSSVSPLLEPLEMDTQFENVTLALMQGASADHARLLFWPGEASVRYLPDDPIPTAGVSNRGLNTYVAGLDSTGEPSLELLARDGAGKAWGENCGTGVGGIGGSQLGARNQGAVSADGGLVYFSTRPGQPEGEDCDPGAHKLRVLERRETDEGPEIGELVESECERVEPACSAQDGDDIYEGASADQTRVYFTTNRQLADTDLDEGTACSGTLGQSQGCDLYLFDATQASGEQLIQVSKGETGSGADVLSGVTGISGDGTNVYFVAQGVLTDEPNSEGDNATEGEPNLYHWDLATQTTTFIGGLAAADGSDANVSGLWGGSGTFRNEAYPVPAVGEGAGAHEDGGSGHILVFQSHAPLTDDDTDGARRDVFRYDSREGELQCLSCRGSESDRQFDVGLRGNEWHQPAGTDAAEIGRWVSEDGQSVVFTTGEGLTAGAPHGVTRGYLWRAGELFALPGTADHGGQLRIFPTLSHSGDVVAFTSYRRLLPADTDGAADVYVARVGGGFPPSEQEPECLPGVGGGCQGDPAPAPEEKVPPSRDLDGEGNVTPAPSCDRLERRVGRAANQARKQRQRARSLRRRAVRQAKRSNVRRARALRQRARRVGRRARANRQRAQRLRVQLSECRESREAGA